MAVPSFHRVIVFTFHICIVENFEPLQKLKVAFKIPFYELLNGDGLIQERRQHLEINITSILIQ